METTDLRIVDLKKGDYKVFDMFGKQWALATAGNMERFNTCTIGWGGLGILWNKPVATVYLYESRYTCDFLKENDTFTVTFFPDEYKKALRILGSRSGRDGDKVALSGLTPVEAGDSVGFEEAELTLVCRKLYQHCMAKEDLAADIQEYYENGASSFPRDENGEWHPHWVFVGEIVSATCRK